MSTKPTSQASDAKQAGMVAIMVTLILMIVISLIVLGFAQISRRNERQAIDRQLSTQAFYAAESGVNDVVQILKSAVVVPEKTVCGSDGNPVYAALDPIIDEANEVEYTCLLVDPTPSSLEYDEVDGTGTIVPLTASSGTIASLELSWRAKPRATDPTPPQPQANCPTTVNNVFFPANETPTGWRCGYGVLRFDLVPTGGTLTLDGLRTATMTTFVVPLRPGSAGGVASVNYATGGANSRVGVVCSSTSCTLRVAGLTQSQYHMRISSLYRSASRLTIRAFDAAGQPLSIQGAQALVDSTGKAQDVLRRIQVRIPLSGSSLNPATDYAIQSTEAICKRFAVMDGFYTSDANTVVPGVGNDTSSTNNPLCDTR